ncbi:Type I Iterative PKS [Claviceps africana]|uniref:Type I Iterative PKS n=1 Tax=Claviceps africana TaxID=83212 RepID=A0A8K0J8N2_9HYPO|nr:Type I Iterative PKS [Claviceps africana]
MSPFTDFSGREVFPGTGTLGTGGAIPRNGANVNYDSPYAKGCANVHGSSDSSASAANGTSSDPAPCPFLKPVAICGIALRLPGGLESPQELWDFLLSKGDARSRVPKSRYNIDAYHSTSGRPGTITTQYGYFLDESVQLGSLDAHRFSMNQADLEFADPQQRRMLEVVREAFDDAGEVNFRSANIGCYMGSYGEDWLQIQTRDHQQTGINAADGYSDFMLSSRISYEMDLKGPCMTIRTACSAALVCLNEAFQAIQSGFCDGAIVGGSNLIMAPGMSAFMTEKGVLSPDGNCKTFSADANGYARAEAVTAVYIKPLDAAIRDGNPVRAVIRNVASNSDGKTQGITKPSMVSQAALIRKAYRDAGISYFSHTAFVECHGTGTPVGDPIEANAVADVFGDEGVYIGSVKPNLGHSEGASGLTSLIKAVLTLENRTIPPNIKFTKENPKIPFKDRKLTVPLEPTPWPPDRLDRVSVNSFGIGGSNAHAILESAQAYGLPQQAFTKSTLESEPQLLLFSAASSSSLQIMTGQFRQWVERNPNKMEELAYTLAMRKEHLPHRSFMVASLDKIPDVASSSRRIGNSTPKLVMVFTGQGAQWPRMGYELLMRQDFVFQSSIRNLDSYLGQFPDGPEWSIEGELLKMAEKSRVQNAELSQPLCTAIQIGLVDLFKSLSIKPYAVVGHSSGEVAAAYAAGVLSAKEAIIIAWQRGLAAKKQCHSGAMAAIGLSKAAAEKFLSPPHVVVACENSPRSITISGDADAVEATIRRINEQLPNTMARLLKVDKAYHSYHMAGVSDFYISALRKYVPSLFDKTSRLETTGTGLEDRVLFFSTVSGAKEPAQPSELRGTYWQENIESPVLFRSAINSVLGKISNVAFLEIGPHPALAGPVRQTAAETSEYSDLSIPYFGAMSRGNNCVESFLSSIGQLFELNIPFDCSRLVQHAISLPDLPHYPWDHAVSSWRESRISRDWRHRQFPAHPLLGIRQLESTTLEPSFRNMLSVEDVPWLRDHCIDGNIIFPCAGYIAMIGEGIRQIIASQDNKPAEKDSFVVRNMILNAALLLKEEKRMEIVTTFHPVRLTNSSNSNWWLWTIASHNGQIWTKHCSGEVTISSFEPQEAPVAVLLPRKVEHRKYYNVLSRSGIQYGPMFRRLSDIRTGTLEGVSTASLERYLCGDEEHYQLHPTIIDGCIQTGPVAATLGSIDDKNYGRVPTKVRRIVVHRVDLETGLRVDASASFVKGSGEVTATIQCIGDGKIVFQMEDAILSPLDTVGHADAGAELAVANDAEGTDTVPKALIKDLVTSRCTWAPHIDFVDAHSLVRPEIPRHIYTPMLDQMARLCFVITQRRLRFIRESGRLKKALPKHMDNYSNWIDAQVQKEPDISMTRLDDVAALDKIAVLRNQMKGTPVEACAAAMEIVLNHIDNIFAGSTDALEILLADNVLTRLYVATDACDRSKFIRHLSHSKPNLRILEIGAGTGASTASLLKNLILPVGHPLYSKYTFTDISAGFFAAAKERFKGYMNLEYRVLDISRDPEEQGFAENEKYDLIVATNVLHATSSLQATLRNVCKLLDRRDGRLLLQELDSNSKWPNYIFGILPGWWYGAEDGRVDEPYVSPERWERELEEAGFTGLDAITRDAEQPHHLNAIMIARMKPRVSSEKKVVLIQDDESLANVMAQRLVDRGYVVTRLRLGEPLPEQPRDVISLIDATRPIFEDIDSGRFAAFQRLIHELNSSNGGMLWVTHLCQVNCKDARYAQIIGTARTIRSELLVDLATCEVDNIWSSLSTIADVFDRFHVRYRVAYESNEGDALDLRPEYEYAIVNGTVRVGRMYPFSPKDELANPNVIAEDGASQEELRVVLDMTKTSRLNTLHWTDVSDAPRKALNPNEVEVKVFAAGLNFKDVLGALGVLPFPEMGLGVEGSGLISRVGVEVGDFQPGNRVMFLANCAFASHVITPAKLCERIPSRMSFEDAASMPAVFATAFACLLNIGQLKKGQSVLIHSAAGGVGLAAVQLAKMIGADIYATVGNDDKVDHLVQTLGLSRSHIFNSRNASFEKGLMRETKGRGVDLALNSLSGPLLHATWRCVAEFGKLVDIGKRDFLDGGKLDMDMFLGSRSYSCFYLDAEAAKRHDIVKDLLHGVVTHFELGLIGPLSPRKLMPISSIQDGFRYLQQGTHIGKIVFSVRQPDGSLNVDVSKAARKTIPKLKLDPSASYLLVGGLGGLGRSVARYLAQQGARSLLFLSRSAGSGAEDAEIVRELESMGVKVQLIRGSVVNEGDVLQAIQKASKLKGIIQVSMVLRDENFTRMSLEQWNQTVAPKVRGTWNLHNATINSGVKLDFFVLFSSMSGVTGQAGQANYAGANTFLDSFVQYRTGLQLACSALDIGIVQDAGLLSQDEALLERLNAANAHGITEAELLEALSWAILVPQSVRGPYMSTDDYTDKHTISLGLSPRVSIGNKDSRVFWRKDRRMAVYHNYSSKTDVGILANGGNEGLRSFLLRAKSDSAILKTDASAKMLANEIGKRLLRLLLKSADDLSTSVPLSQLGMDSLVGVEMRSWWRQAFGFDISLLELLGMTSLDELGKHAATGLLKLFGDGR